MKKNMFELFRDKELPGDIQDLITAFTSECKSEEERLFKAGFICAKHIKEIRKQRGIEE